MAGTNERSQVQNRPVRLEDKPPMPKKPGTNLKGEFAFFNVVYEDDSVRSNRHHHGAENFIADVEVVVREAAALVGKDAVVRVLGGVFRHADAEVRPCSMLLKMK
jgi:hypothetical protein